MAPRVEPPILVIRLSSLGDVARLLPSLRALGLAGIPADLTVEDRFEGLLRLFPYARKIQVYPRRGPGSPARHPLAWSRAFREYVKALRRERYGTALDLHGILRSAVVARLSGAAATVGYAKGFGKEASHLFYGTGIAPAPSPRISRYERYAGVLRALGLPEPGPDFLEPEVPPEAREDVDAFLGARALGAGYLFAFLGTSRAQARKRWPATRFLELARRLWQEANLPTVVGWGPEEAELVATLPGQPYLHPIPPWDLDRLVEVIRRARGFVGADTGAMHLAALMGVPTVAILGPTDPVLNRPFGPRAGVVHREGIREACAGGACDHRSCMGAIGVEEVLEPLRSLMGDGP